MVTVSANSDRTLVVLKPDAIRDGLRDSILNALESYCSDNSLRINSTFDVVLTERILWRHFVGKGYEFISNVGKKCSKAMESAGMHCEEEPYVLGYRVIMGQIRGMEGQGALVAVVEGHGAVAKLARFKGATDSKEADACSIRGMFRSTTTILDVALGGVMENRVHVPDNEEEAVYDFETFMAPEQLSAPVAHLMRRKASGEVTSQSPV